METPDLESLHERIVDQETYPGGACLTELSLARYVTGAFSPDEKRKADEHLAECSECRRSVEQLREADAWLAQNASHVFAGMLEKAKARGLAPWATRPSDQELECYLARRVPASDAGRRFTEQLEEKIADSSALQEALERVRNRLRERVSVAWADARRRSSEAVEVMKQICSGVQSVASAQGVAQVVRAMPGYRAQPAPTVEAAVLDAEGYIALDEEGNPCKATFSLFRAQVDDDGHFIIDMATADRDYWETAQRRFEVTACLEHESRRVVLPAEKVYPDGRVTIVGNLLAGMEIKQIPPSVMVLTLTPQDKEDEPTETD